MFHYAKKISAISRVLQTPLEIRIECQRMRCRGVAPNDRNFSCVDCLLLLLKDLVRIKRILVDLFAIIDGGSSY